MPSVPAKPLSRRVALKRIKIKEEILATALNILSDQGVEGLTLAAVTTKLGFSKPAIYHYFRSKEDLVRSLVLELLRQEGDELFAAVSRNNQHDVILGALIRAFYRHYRSCLNAFRLVYCQFQLMDIPALGIDQNTFDRDIHPITQQLFDVVEAALGSSGQQPVSPETRQLAFSAWLAAVGLMQMISIAEAANDPLRHSDETLLGTLENVFNTTAVAQYCATATAT